MARSPVYFSSRAVTPEPGSAMHRDSLTLPRLIWVPLLARLILEVLGSTTRLELIMPASLSWVTALIWLRDNTLWQTPMYSFFSSPRSHPDRQGLMNNSR